LVKLARTNHVRPEMRREQEILGSSDRELQRSLEGALMRLVKILARQLAREAVASAQAPIITEPADE
jgi:hypothetical protein